MANTPDQIAKKIESTLDDIKALPGKVELFAAQQANVKIVERVFTGGATKDVNGKLLSPYTEKYTEYREELGLQVAKKDLQVSGALLRSVVIGRKGDKVVCGITTERYADIASGQEKQNDTKIFQLSAAERANIKTETIEYTKNELKKIFAKWR